MKLDNRLVKAVLVASVAGLLAGMALTIPWLPLKLGPQPLGSVGIAGFIVGFALIVSGARLRKMGAIVAAVSIVLVGLTMVRSSQRSLAIVAEADISVTEIDDWSREVGKVPAGSAR